MKRLTAIIAQGLSAMFPDASRLEVARLPADESVARCPLGFQRAGESQTPVPKG